MKIFSNELHYRIENGKREIRKSDKEWIRRGEAAPEKKKMKMKKSRN